MGLFGSKIFSKFRSFYKKDSQGYNQMFNRAEAKVGCDCPVPSIFGNVPKPPSETVGAGMEGVFNQNTAICCEEDTKESVADDEQPASGCSVILATNLHLTGLSAEVSQSWTTPNFIGWLSNTNSAAVLTVTIPKPNGTNEVSVINFDGGGIGTSPLPFVTAGGTTISFFNGLITKRLDFNGGEALCDGQITVHFSDAPNNPSRTRLEYEQINTP